AVVDEQVVWVVEGFTSTDLFPYSASLSSGNLFYGDDEQLTPPSLNYVRNSVKATVNAYDGTVTLYAWDPDDAILKTWSKIFPTSFQPISDISEDLMGHLRYPEALFSIQRHQLTRYHVNDAASFYSSQDFW